MAQSGMVERNDLLATKADLLNQEFDLQQNIINISSKIKEIEIMTGRDNLSSVSPAAGEENKTKSGKDI